MANKVISYSVILKRSNSLNSKVIMESNNSDVLFNRVKPSIEKPILSIAEKNMIVSYFNSLACIEEASSSYYRALDIIDGINESSFKNQLITLFNERILPYIQDLTYISESLNRYQNISECEKNSILETAIGYNIADRILKNHAYLSKCFNIENVINKYNYKNMHDIVEQCGSMIDTYSMDTYKKLNICIEEMCYLLEKNGYKYDKPQLVQYITEYFILSMPEFTSRDMNNFKRTLEESYLLEDDDLCNIDYLFESDDDYKSCSINKTICEFYKTLDKSSVDFDINQNGNLKIVSVKDLEHNISRYIRFLWNVFDSGLYPEVSMIESCKHICDFLALRLTDDAEIDSFDNDFVAKSTLNSIIDSIEKELSEIVIYNDTDSYKAEKINTFKSIVNDNLVAPLQAESSIVYGRNNLVAMEGFNLEKLLRAKENISSKLAAAKNVYNNAKDKLKNFKIFKFNNLIKASINLDKMLQAKEKALLAKAGIKGKKMLTKVNNVLFNESSSIYQFIGEDNKVDITVAQYYYDENYVVDIHEFFENIVRETNNKLLLDDNTTTGCYYIMNPGIVEVHIKDNTELELTEEDVELINKTPDPSLDVYIENLAYIDSIMEAYNDLIDEKSINEMLIDIDENFDFEHYELAMEAMKYLSVSKDDIELFTERYSVNKMVSDGNTYGTINESKQVHNILENWKAYDNVPLHIQLEAYQLLLAIMEDATDVNKGKKSLEDSTFNKTKDSTYYNDGKSNKKFDLKKTKNDPDFDKETEYSKEQKKELLKNPFKGININSIRLFLKGLESKMGKMSQQEKELSKQLDASVRRLVKSMKDALISDRREAIIKGSVIPSFSKCIKIAVALAGIGKVAAIGTGAAFNPVVPLVIALGGFAMSKRLTKKERLLLLDDIEIEIEVLDKEIANAESHNQMKKLRALMKYKKDLQRQYQRIRYNARVGKDILPNSSVGLKDYDD